MGGSGGCGRTRRASLQAGACRAKEAAEEPGIGDVAATLRRHNSQRCHAGVEGKPAATSFSAVSKAPAVQSSQRCNAGVAG